MLSACSCLRRSLPSARCLVLALPSGTQSQVTAARAGLSLSRTRRCPLGHGRSQRSSAVQSRHVTRHNRWATLLADAVRRKAPAGLGCLVVGEWLARDATEGTRRARGGTTKADGSRMSAVVVYLLIWSSVCHLFPSARGSPSRLPLDAPNRSPPRAPPSWSEPSSGALRRSLALSDAACLLPPCPLWLVGCSRCGWWRGPDQIAAEGPASQHEWPYAMRKVEESVGAWARVGPWCTMAPSDVSRRIVSERDGVDNSPTRQHQRQQNARVRGPSGWVDAHSMETVLTLFVPIALSMQTHTHVRTSSAAAAPDLRLASGSSREAAS